MQLTGWLQMLDEVVLLFFLRSVVNFPLGICTEGMAEASESKKDDFNLVHHR